MQTLRRGEWRGQPAVPLGRDPQGKVLGVLGLGGIGRNLMRKCEGLGMRTIYHNRRKLGEAEAGGAEWVGFEELLAGSDVLSLNLPLNVGLLFTRDLLAGVGSEGRMGRLMTLPSRKPAT